MTTKNIEAIYDYTDMNGHVIHSSIRYKNHKGFSQRRPDPANPSKWVYNLKDIKTVVYNLPAVTEAIKNEKPIFIVEGEKDCDNLKGLGFTATTSPMGAGKWRDYYADYLKDGICYIIADNDEPGIKHSIVVEKALKGRVKSVKMINLKSELPDLPEHGDITDFFRIISDREEGLTRFNRLIGAVEVGEQPTEWEKYPTASIRRTYYK